jgi:mannose-1-phosphate guanylyltransferase
MRRALSTARRAARTGVDRVLIGARAECAASDLGWIVPRPARLRRCVASIETFVEKPGPDIAARLFEGGALWNTMLCVARGQALWQLGRQLLPAQVARRDEMCGASVSGRTSERLRDVYERLTPADVSRDRVAASRRLRVAAMDGAGWSDCGTPERLVAALGDKVGTMAGASQVD